MAIRCQGAFGAGMFVLAGVLGIGLLFERGTAVPNPPSDEAIARARTALAVGDCSESEGAGGFNEPQARVEFHLEQRLPAGATRLPTAHLLQERERLLQREQLLDSSAVAAAGGVRGWKSLGPGNIGGRTRAIVIDPVNTNVMYAAGVAGGVWKSTDAGASWLPLDDLMLNLAVCSLVIDPFDSNVLYAGTGEGWFLSSVFVQGFGIFKSTDAWRDLGSARRARSTACRPARSTIVNRLVMSPERSSGRIYAGTRTGVWRSDDGGRELVGRARGTHSTSAVPRRRTDARSGAPTSSIRSDTTPDMLFAAFGSLQADGLYRSLRRRRLVAGLHGPDEPGAHVDRARAQSNRTM